MKKDHPPEEPPEKPKLETQRESKEGKMVRLSGGAKTGLAAVITLAVLALSLVFPTIGSAIAVEQTTEEQQLLQLVNQARAEAGLAPLYAEQQLTTMARDYSAEMIQYDFFGHVSPVSGDLQARVAAHGITGWLLAGENIAKSPNIESAFKAFMNSPSHRDNILKPDYNCTGIGVLQGPNGLVVTQEFMNFAEIPATADVPGQGSVSPAVPQTLFDTYVLVMNPNSSPANVDVVFQDDAGNQRTFNYKVAAHSRYTITARDTLGTAGAFATTINSDIPVLAERAMYFNSEGRAGGHDSIGASQPSPDWYFAEGFTGGSFDTYILVMNPNANTVTATLNFMLDDGRVVPHQVSIPAGGRKSVHVDGVSGLENANVSTQVTCSQPVVAERSMYFNYNGKAGGHNSIGVTQPSPNWYFAEGFTGGSFDTWVLLQNPNSSAVTATLTFMADDGRVIPYKVVIPAKARYTVPVDAVAGLDNASVSTQVTCDKPIVAERAMYFNYEGNDDGHDSIGVTQPADNWYFAEGFTGGSFDTWVLVQNPNPNPVNVTYNFMLEDGRVVPYKVTIGARSRYTVKVDAVAGLDNASVSTQVTSDQPVVAERAMYFNYNGKDGGHNSIGSEAPATTWYFAEGSVQ